MEAKARGRRRKDVIVVSGPAPLGHPFCLNPSFAREMSEFPDYYAILGISKTSTTEEVRSAYKRESLRCAVATAYHAFDSRMSLILAANQDSS
jgi:hypothetical protein